MNTEKLLKPLNLRRNWYIFALSVMGAVFLRYFLGLTLQSTQEFYYLSEYASFTEWKILYLGGHIRHAFTLQILNVFYRLWLLAPVKHVPLEQMITQPLMDPDFLVYRAFMKTPIILFDVFTGIILYKTAFTLSNSKKISYLVLMLWLFNPYVIEEVVITGEVDIFGTFFVALGTLLFLWRRYFSAGLSIGLGVLARFYPLILIPFFILLLRKKVQPKITFLLAVFLPIIGVLTLLSVILKMNPLWIIWRFPLRGDIYLTNEEFLWFFGYIASSKVFPEIGLSIIFTIYVLHILAVKKLWKTGDRAIYDASVIPLLAFFGFAFWNKYHSIWIVPFITLEYGLNRDKAGKRAYTILFILFFISMYIYVSYWIKLGVTFIPPTTMLIFIREEIIGYWNYIFQGWLLETFNRSLLAAISVIYIVYISLRNIGFHLTLTRPQPCISAKEMDSNYSK